MELRINLTASEHGIRIFAGTQYQDSSRMIESETATPTELIELAQLADRICGHPTGIGPFEKHLLAGLRGIADKVPEVTTKHLTEGARLVDLAASITKALPRG